MTSCLMSAIRYLSMFYTLAIVPFSPVSALCSLFSRLGRVWSRLLGLISRELSHSSFFYARHLHGRLPLFPLFSWYLSSVIQ